MQTTQTTNSFEALTQSILEKERQMQELAAQVAQQRIDVLNQITSAMSVLNITIDDIASHAAHAQAPTTESAPAEATAMKSEHTAKSDSTASANATTDLHDKVTASASAKSDKDKDAATEKEVQTQKTAEVESAKPQTAVRGTGAKFNGFGAAKTA